MVLQKIQGCLELRLSPFLLFLCPPDAYNFYYLISSFWDQILISSLNLGRARLSLRHLFGWSTAVRDLQREGNFEALSALSLITNEGEKKDDSCREDSQSLSLRMCPHKASTGVQTWQEPCDIRVHRIWPPVTLVRRQPNTLQNKIL